MCSVVDLAQAITTMSAAIKAMACTVTLAGGVAGALMVAVSMACMLMTLNNMMSTFIMMFDYLNGDPDAGEDLIDSATWNFVLSVGINAGGFAAKKTLQNILKSDLVRTIGTDCTERLMREFADVKDLSKYVKQILKMEISSGVIIEISEKFGKSGLDWIIGRKSVGLTDDLIRKILKADSLDNFTDDVVKAIKNSDGYADDMVELVNRYGRDAADAIAKYGDEAVEVLKDYGDEAVEGFKDGKTQDEVRTDIESGSLSDDRVAYYLSKSLNNANSNTAILGSTGSYDVIGEAKGYTYFKMKDEIWAQLETETMQNYDEIWKVNKLFIDMYQENGMLFGYNTAMNNVVLGLLIGTAVLLILFIVLGIVLRIQQGSMYIGIGDFLETVVIMLFPVDAKSKKELSRMIDEMGDRKTIMSTDLWKVTTKGINPIAFYKLKDAIG